MTIDEADADYEISKLYGNENVKEFWSWGTPDERNTMLMEGKVCL